MSESITLKKMLLMALASASLCAAIVMAVASCATAVSNATGEARTWAFVQSVGGIAIDRPDRNDSGGWDLPVNADVSGKDVTTKATAHNGALACRTSAAVEGSSIYITISTEAVGVMKTATCPSVHLEGMQPGRYMVYYRGPNEDAVKLSFVELKPNLR